MLSLAVYYAEEVIGEVRNIKVTKLGVAGDRGW